MPKHFVFVPELKLDGGTVPAIVYAKFLKKSGNELVRDAEPIAVFDPRYLPGEQYLAAMLEACDARYDRLWRESQPSP